MKIKKIKWIDSNMSLSQTDEIIKPVVIESIGYIIEETKDYITIARDIVDDEYRGQLSIPKCSIYN